MTTKLAKLTLTGRSRNALYVPVPFAFSDLGEWRDSTARAIGEARAVVHWDGRDFKVQETAAQLIELHK